MELSDEQVDLILVESLNYRLYECDLDGNLPEDPKVRKAVAVELVTQAQLVYAAGNRMDSVKTLLFIADLEDEVVAPVRKIVPNKGEDMAEPTIKDIPDEQLRKFERSLASSTQQTEEVQTQLQLIRGEMTKRGIPLAGEDSPATAAPAAPAEPDPAPEESPFVEEAQDPRVDLESQLTLAMLRAHSVDPNEVEKLSVESLQYIIANPTGGPQEAPPAPVAPVAVAPAPAVVAPGGGISAEREALEEQVSGQMLKAYGRGRRDVPDIGDHELALMVNNPECKITPAQLEEARALDRGEVPVAVAEPTPEPAPQPVADAFAPPVPEAPVAVAPAPVVLEPEAVAETRKERVPVQRSASKNLATEIIEREHFPIPPDVEEAPVLPADMSALGREELYSLHARFHAVEARANYVITVEEGKLADATSLRKAAEVAAANALPTTVDRKKLTEAQRDSLVAADPEVQQFAAEEREIANSLRVLKAMRDGFHSTVERASRQLTRFSSEYGGGS